MYFQILRHPQLWLIYYFIYNIYFLTKTQSHEEI